MNNTTYFNDSTAFGTANGPEEKKPPAKPASSGVLIGGCIQKTHNKSQFITGDVFMHFLTLLTEISMTSTKRNKTNHIVKPHPA